MSSLKPTTRTSRPLVFSFSSGSSRFTLVVAMIQLLSLLLSLLSNADRSSEVVLVAAFPIQRTGPSTTGTLPSTTTTTTKTPLPGAFNNNNNAAAAVEANGMRRNVRRYSSTIEDVVAIKYKKDVSIIDIDIAILKGGENDDDANDDDLGDSTDILLPAPPPPMALSHKGSSLQLSSVESNGNTNNNAAQEPILLFDGLSPDIWTSTKPVAAEGSSTTTPLPSSFSSLTLQTRIPSVAIESLFLGEFLASSASSNEDPQRQRQLHQQRHPHKFLAASRLNRYWMGPKFGEGGAAAVGNKDSKIPVDTQFLLVEIQRDEPPEQALSMSTSTSTRSSSPYYALLMPLVDGGFRSALESTSDSILDEDKQHESEGREGNGQQHRLALVSYSESGENLQNKDATSASSTTTATTRNAMYVAVHDEPYELLRLGFQQVSELLGESFQTLDKKQIPTEFVNSFGWCSWDAFYSKVHPAGILEGVKCLTDAGIPVKNVILDDGWQQVSPPYLHQQEEVDKKTSSLAASLSLSGSSDILLEEEAASSNSMEASKTDESDSSLMSFISRNPLDLLSSIGGSIFGVIASGVTNCYQKYVEKAPVDSLPKRLWTFLARHTPLNYGLWKFFDSETDFGRQLNDFDPNWKFLKDPTEKSENEIPQKDNKNMALKELVTALKQDWKVNRVYCWHSMHGYWRGVSTELGQSIGIDVTQIKTRPSDHLLRVEPEMAFDPPSLFGVGLIGKKGDLSKFFKHLHEPLVAAGVDGVKVDVQSGVTAAGMQGDGFPDCPPLAKVYTQAMEESVAQRFPSASTAGSSSQAVECINCMCHSTENLYRYKHTAVARASDDFYPARPESHSVHLVNVAYNSLFLGEICLPDWDMFHSKHESADLHAAARAIGGCSVYVSDAPGKHNIPLLKKLVLPDGSVLRAQQPGRPTRDCLFADVGRDGTSALKIWNVNQAPPKTTTTQSIRSRNAVGRGGVVGAFNVQGVAWNFETNDNEILDASPPAVKAFVKPHDVDSLRQIAGPFAVWSHRTQSMQLLPTGDSTIETVLEHREWEVHTVQPVQRNEDFGVQWAPIGLGKMLNSGGAIIDVAHLAETDDVTRGDEDDRIATATIYIHRKRLQADITTRGPGYFVSYCQPRPSHVLIRNGLVASTSSTKQLDFQHDGLSGLLEFDLPPETIEGNAHYVTVVWEQ